MLTKRKITRILLLFLIMLLAWVTGWFRYYSQYMETRNPIHIEECADNTIRVMSLNLHRLTPWDMEKKSWFYRAPLIVQQMENIAPGIIGFQEAMSWQYEYLCDVLPEYESVITYRDARVFSEGCPIFFNKTRYKLVESGSFWLSETPENMSKSWDSQEYGVCSYIVLEDLQTQREFAVFNTHLDYANEEIKIQGIEIILEQAKLLSNIPFVIMGDLNTEEDSEVYAIATQYCQDACYQAKTAISGPTYQGWGKEEQAERLDYFLVSPDDITVESYTTVSTEEGDYLSDHNAIFMDMTLNQLRVMTYNIRYMATSDKGNRNWEIRKHLVVEDILQRKPDILCLQEVKAKQQTDLETALTDYNSYIVYRDNTLEAEGCPIFWNREAYILLDKGTIWLSKTPEVVSKDWGSAYPRICTYVILKERSTGKNFVVFNTHLDHVSEEARVKGMSVIIDFLKQFPNIPCVLTGDYNDYPNTPLYQLATSYLEDGKYSAKHVSGYGTYHQWGKIAIGKRIDYIMLSQSSFQVFQNHVIPVLHDGVFSSDHSPVIIDMWFA